MTTPWLIAGLVVGCAMAIGTAGCTARPAIRSAAFAPAQLSHVISAGSASIGHAELDVVSGATAVDIGTADLHGALYQVMTPVDSNSAPVATVDGDVVRVSLAFTPQPGPASVRIVLSSRVSWHLRLDGGAASESVDLADARLAGLEFGAGCSNIDVTLPRPNGTVPITMSGGASTFELHLPTGVPARVSFAGGAGSATVDGASRSGIAGGVVVATANWTATPNRYLIDNTAGVAALTLDNAA